jgi:hypothetical protein
MTNENETTELFEIVTTAGLTYRGGKKIAGPGTLEECNATARALAAPGGEWDAEDLEIVPVSA